MKIRNYKEYPMTHNLPEEYKLKVSEIEEMAKQTGAPLSSDLLYTINGIYTYAFERGQKYERKRLKEKS